MGARRPNEHRTLNGLDTGLLGLHDDSDGLDLTKAFLLIKNAKLRRSIVRLVEDLVGAND